MESVETKSARYVVLYSALFSAAYLLASFLVSVLLYSQPLSFLSSDDGAPSFLMLQVEEGTFSGTWIGIFAGLVILYFVAFGIALIFSLLISPRHFIPQGKWHWLICGLLYGALTRMVWAWLNTSDTFIGSLIERGVLALALGVSYVVAFRLYPLPHPRPPEASLKSSEET